MILPPAELDFILSGIREECRAGGRWFGETEAEQDVIVQTVLCFINDRLESDVHRHSRGFHCHFLNEHPRLREL